MNDRIIQYSNAFVSRGKCHYRIPVIAVEGEGKLFAFANCRMVTVADSAREVALVVRRRDCFEKNWSPLFPGKRFFKVNASVHTPNRMCIGDMIEGMQKQ